MKSRMGYVSNSSSSSFIIMYNDDSKLLMHGRGKKTSVEFEFTIGDMLDVVEHSPDYHSDSTQLVADGMENVIDYVTEKDYSGYSRYDEKYSDAIMKKINANKDKYSEAAILRVEYSDKLVRNLLEAFIKSGEIIEIDSEEA